MNITSSKDGTTRKVRFDGELTIYHAPRARNTLLNHLDGCERLEIDLGGVSEIDTAGAQILIMLRGEAARRGKGFSLGSLSDGAAELIRLYNLNAFFGADAR